MSPSAESCPKCGQARLPGRDSCVRCGLVFALWSPEKAAAVVELDASAEALWRATVEGWEDLARHDAFVKHCSAAGLLAPAGRRYRAHLDAHPSDGLAARMQERIVAMATAALAVRTTPPQPVTRSTWFWVVLGLFAVGGVLAGLLFGRGAG